MSDRFLKKSVVRIAETYQLKPFKNLKNLFYDNIKSVVSKHEIKRKFLRDRYNALVFKLAEGREVYLVGGYIRDFFRNVYSKDRDYIVSRDFDDFLNQLKEKIGGTCIEFKKSNMVRLALENDYTLDFSIFCGTIEEDLAKRDFTVNAIAWSPEKSFIDLYNGTKDIKEKRIRCIAKENLKSDPLRILRAYRFASELEGFIDKRTRSLLKKLSKNIKKVATERITLEFFHLLNQKTSSRYLKMALDDDLLNNILCFDNSDLKIKIRAIYEFEKSIFEAINYRFKVQLDNIFSQNLTYKGLLCLEILLDKHIYENHKCLLNLSNKIRKRLKKFGEGLRFIKRMDYKNKERLFELFFMAGEASLDILIGKGRYELLKEYKRFDRVWKRGLLHSEEIMKMTGLTEGPEIGKIIKELKKAQFEGIIRNRKQAVKYLSYFT